MRKQDAKQFIDPASADIPNRVYTRVFSNLRKIVQDSHQNVLLYHQHLLPLSINDRSLR